jgi:dienelactone hydrolase
LAAQLPPVPDTVEAWEESRADLVADLTSALGLPDREPMKAAVADTREDGDLVIQEVVYLWAGRTYASATVIRGKTDGRRGAIVIPSGGLGHYTFLPYRKFVDTMAGQGLLVLFIDDPRTGKRQAPNAGLYWAASAAGTQLAGIQVFDALRALDYLLTRTDVDGGKIGIAGLGDGALQAYMAAALEPRFQFVIAVDGTTTNEALVQAAAEGQGPEDPSAFVTGILGFADTDRIAASIAPRPVFLAGTAAGGPWAEAGYTKVLDTMRAVHGLYGAADRIREVRGERSDDMGAYASEITRWLQSGVLPSLEGPAGAPLACGEPEDPGFSMLGRVEQRIAEVTASLPVEPESEAAWRDYRNGIAQWLRSRCVPDSMKPAADLVVEASDSGGLTTEQLALGVDGDFRCPAVLVRPSEPAGTKAAGVILSHDDRGSARAARIADAARRLASGGYWVIVPDHASVHPQSHQPLAQGDEPSFYGDEAARFYGPADVVGLPPLALRVAENLAAFRYLASRAEVDPERIVIAGMGTGGVDACLAAVLEEAVAGVASVDATTLRDWVAHVAPGELRFFHIMPGLPSILTQTDLDFFYAAIAPRPLVLVKLKDGWARSGFDQVVTTASAIYTLHQAEQAMRALGPRAVTEELEAGAPEGVQKQLIAAARTLVPTPPQPGIVGSVDGLKSRRVVDSASGLIWIVAEMDGYDQEFAGSDYRLQTWSFFNDNGDAQKGRMITPLVFRKQGEKYQLTGIGKTQSNAGTGVQEFSFDAVEGTTLVGDGCFFGWHTGDLQGKHNPGVAEFEDAPDSLMFILTADGQMSGQRPTIGDTYRVQSQFRRRYSVMAVSEKP